MNSPGTYPSLKLCPYFLLFFLCASSSLLYGLTDRPYVDSLLLELPKIQDDSLLFEVLYDIAHEHPNIDTSLIYNYRALDVAKKTGYQAHLGKIYFALGQWHEQRGKYEQALSFLDQSYLHCEKAEAHLYLVHGLRLKAVCLYELDKNEEANNVLIKAIDLAQEHKLELLSAIISYTIGNNFITQKENEKAIENLKKAEVKFNALKDQQGVCLCKYSINTILKESAKEQRELEALIEPFQYLVSEKCDMMNPSTLASTNSILGAVYMDLGRFAEAAPYLKKGVSMAKSSKTPSAIIYCLGHLATFHSLKGEEKLAFKYLSEAETVAEEQGGEKGVLLGIQESKLLVLKNLGKVDETFQALEDYKKIYEQYIIDEQKGSVEELNIKYKSLEKEKEIAQQKLIAANQTQKFNRLLMLGIGIGAGLLALLFWYSNKLKTKRKDTERLQELDKLKTTFFTNISHEFRTPLTLILSPLKKYLNQKENNQTQINIPLKDMEVMVKNGSRLQKMIDQLLNLSKLDDNQLSVNKESINLNNLVNSVLASFAGLAEQYQIKLNFIAPTTPIEGQFDRGKMQTILFNLLSNAFKYTEENGQIELQLKKVGHRIQLEVADTGLGIAAEHLPHIFDRFYQSENAPIRLHDGSGVGLSLTQGLVQLLGGSISATSQINQGTKFNIELPFEVSEAPAVVIKDSQIAQPIIENGKTFTPVSYEDTIPAEEHRLKVLIVEDHEDLRGFVKRQLQSQYQVIEATDGKSGLKAALEAVPDLIITDIMMPGQGQDGLQLLKALKGHELTSHIPVILLTAKASSADQIKGFEVQADAYFTKPFDADVLMARVKNLIEQRKKLRVLFAEAIQIVPEDLPVSSQEEVFLRRVIELMEENISNENFGVEQMGNALNIDRSQLFRKVKALTGKSPSVVLKDMRLQRAKYLLENRSGNVSEIARQVGFRTPEYFSRAFKKEFGSSPGEILKVK